MKMLRSLLVLSVLFALNAAGQNYRTLPLKAKQHYYMDADKYIFPIEPDSIITESGDTIVYHFKTPRYIRKPNGYYSYDTAIANAPSWAGLKTIIKATGENIWFAAKGDSMVFKQNAGLHETWFVNRQKNIAATVTAINFHTFAGVADSVKTISIGNRDFLLSKNYGFVTMHDIYNFYQPDSSGIDYPFSGTSSPLQLYGSTLIAGSKTKLTDKLFNDYKVNDVFVKSTYAGIGDYLGPPISYSKTTLYTVTSKVIVPDSQLVRYTIDFCEADLTDGYRYINGDYKYIKTGNFSFGSKPLVLSYADSGTTPLKQKRLYSISYGLYFPVVLYLDSNGRMVENDVRRNETFMRVDSNVYVRTYIVTRKEANITPLYNGKLEGVGNFYSYFDFSGINYYKSDTVTFGTPTDCETLRLSTITAVEDETLVAVVVVNPFQQFIQVKSTVPLSSISVLNMHGQVILHETPALGNQQKDYMLSSEGVIQGVYVLVLSDINGRIHYHKIVKE